MMKIDMFKVMRLAFAATVLGFAGQGVVYGKITRGSVKTDTGKALSGVQVSDGINIIATDLEGNFAIDSEIPLGYLFVITPNGYEPATYLQSRPKFWETAKSGDRIQFRLRKIENDAPIGIIAVADPQISNRCGDVERLKQMYLPEVNRAIDSLRNKGTDPIVMTLGDVVCDYFVARGYGYTLDKFNEDFKVKAALYHTMGNHDNDPFKSGDIYGASTWHDINGPSYYSFNRGGVHFLVLDNIVSVNEGAAPGVPGNRSTHTALTKEQLDWVAKDLAALPDKNIPVVVTMHAPLLTFPVGDGEKLKETYRFKNGASELGELLKDFPNVRV